MITEDYCSYEIAKLLKEKGFDEYCWKLYELGDCDKPVLLSSFWNNKYLELYKKEHCHINDICSAPTLQMAMKWLREEHKVFIYVEPFITTSGLQGYKPYCTKIGGEFMWINPLRKYSNTSSDTYEGAVEAALKYSLENLL